MPIFNITHCFPGGLSLRPATAADALAIASMHARSWVTSYRGILPDAFLDNRLTDDRVAFWNARMPELLAGAGEAFIAQNRGVPIGFMCLVNPDHTASVLVDNLHAMPGFKGLGAGSAMLAHATAWARARGAQHLHLYVLEDNLPAIAFYKSRGWSLAAREDDRMGGIDLIALRYVFALT